MEQTSSSQICIDRYQDFHYLISLDEPLKIGDWITWFYDDPRHNNPIRQVLAGIIIDDSEVGQANAHYSIQYNSHDHRYGIQGVSWHVSECNKVIASTNPEVGLPFTEEQRGLYLGIKTGIV